MQDEPKNSARDSGLPVIRVLVADDSVIVRSALTRMLKHSPADTTLRVRCERR